MPRSISRLAVASFLAVTSAACSGGEGGAPTVTTPVETRVASVALAAANGAATVRPGRTLTLGATLKDAAGRTLTGRAVAWRSSADAVARVDANGVVTGVAAGTADIVAASEGAEGTMRVTVQAPGVATVSVARDTATLALGDATTLVATVRDDEGAVMADRAVRWSSSAPAVATVDSVTGTVRAVAGGAAIITATHDGRTAQVRITVRVPVATVTVGTALDTLEAHDVVALQATTRDANGAVLTDRTIRWTSSNPAVATIDSVTGRLTGLDRGTVTVTATSEGKVGTASRVVVIKYRSLTAGSEHACDIASGGILWCWGNTGREGRLGTAAVASGQHSAVPVRVDTQLRFTQVATYGNTTCAVSRDARAYCWGSNAGFLLGGGASLPSGPTLVAVNLDRPVRQVSVSGSHACALTTNGEAWCWGPNSDGQLGTGTTTWAEAPVRAAASVPGMAGAPIFASLSVGSDYTCGVTTDGTGLCWGADGLGQLGDGRPLSLGNTSSRLPVVVTGGHRWQSLSASNQVTCGVTVGGEGYCWGRRDGSRLGSVGSATSTPRRVAGGLTFRHISTGHSNVCGVTTDAAVWCWGLGGNGQLGQVLVNGSETPVRVSGGLQAAQAVAANVSGGDGAYACATSPDLLTVSCWGRNTFGQLGNGTTTGHTAVNATPSIVQGQRPLAATR